MWLKGRKMSATSEDSTEDLISNEVTQKRPSDSTLNDYTDMNTMITNVLFYKKKRLINKSLVLLCILLLILFLTFMCLYFHERSQIIKKDVCVTRSCVETAAFMESSMDKTIDPCKDFYLYSCAGWITNNPIPTGESIWDTIHVLSKKNYRTLKSILENTTVKSKKDLDSQAEYNAFKLYRSCRNMKEINRLGISPLVSLIKKVGKFLKKNENSSERSLDSLLHKIYRETLSIPFFDITVGTDDKNSDNNIVKVEQSGLGLEQYVYKDKSNSSQKIIDEYKKYNVKLAKMMDSSFSEEEFQEIVEEVFDFETKLQNIFVPRKEMTTIDTYYYKTGLVNFQRYFTKINWNDLLRIIFEEVQIEIKSNESMLIYSMPYFKKLDKLLQQTHLRVIQNHALFRLMRHYSSLLTEDVIELHRNLTLADSGVYKPLERWKRCVSSVDSFIGMATGALFVKKNFAKDSRNQATEMVKQLRGAFIEGFQSLDWMDDRTKAAAKIKAESIIEKIGYPKFVTDISELDKYYEGMFFNEMKYFENIHNAAVWYKKFNYKKLRKKVDKKSWYMTPPTVNAYYDPTKNEIVFPAGILQPPYFKYDYPKVVNYGMMGSVIGHEITHAFDNNGRLYDEKGNFGKSWWSQKAEKEFKERSNCFVKEYSNFKILDKNIDGNITLAENIADNGGLKAAYRAYKNYVKKHGEEPILPGVSVTNEQAFFIAFAQSWCTEELAQRLIKAINTDPHSPASERVHGSIQNNVEFARAFNCPKGSPMNPRVKCAIWS